MLKITMTHENGISVARLAGMLDESVDFDKEIGAPPVELHVYCGAVDRINSQGIRAWIAYFQRFSQRNAKLEFHACSPVIVQCINDLHRFACGGQVMSIQLPYFCAACDKIFTVLATRESLLQPGFKGENSKCPDCGKAAALDEDPASYFRFVKAGP